MDWQRVILGTLVDLGYLIKEWPDHVVSLQWKEEQLAVWSIYHNCPTATLAELMLSTARSHYQKMTTGVPS